MNYLMCLKTINYLIYKFLKILNLIETLLYNLIITSFSIFEIYFNIDSVLYKYLFDNIEINLNNKFIINYLFIIYKIVFF